MLQTTIILLYSKYCGVWILPIKFKFLDSDPVFVDGGQGWRFGFTLEGEAARRDIRPRYV